MVDVRYLWFMQKRYQGSHLFNDEQAAAFNELVRDGKIQHDPRQGLPLRGDRARASADGRRPASRGQRDRARERPAGRPHRPALSPGVSASCTSSTSTPPIERGCTNAIEVSREPRPGSLVDRAARPRRAGARAPPRCRSRGTRRGAGPGLASRATVRPGCCGPSAPSSCTYDEPDGEQHLLDPLVLDALPVRRLDAEQPPVLARPPSRGPSTAMPTWSMSVSSIRHRRGPGSRARRLHPRDQIVRPRHVVGRQRERPSSRRPRRARAGPARACGRWRARARAPARRTRPAPGTARSEGTSPPRS